MIRSLNPPDPWNMYSVAGDDFYFPLVAWGNREGTSLHRVLDRLIMVPVEVRVDIPIDADIRALVRRWEGA